MGHGVKNMHPLVVMVYQLQTQAQLLPWATSFTWWIWVSTV
jgi:hypothetical protein